MNSGPSLPVQIFVAVSGLVFFSEACAVKVLLNVEGNKSFVLFVLGNSLASEF
jgi:hypothetical protein